MRKFQRAFATEQQPPDCHSGVAKTWIWQTNLMEVLHKQLKEKEEVPLNEGSRLNDQ